LAGPFALAIIDIELPDGDGVALAEHLLTSGAVASVVFHTATRDAARRDAAAALGVVVEKEQGIERLLRVVEITLAERAEPVLAVAVPDETVPQRESGRSGTRRRVR
jgi:DNA-binding NarL/FixJ family response regulator